MLNSQTTLLIGVSLVLGALVIYFVLNNYLVLNQYSRKENKTHKVNVEHMNNEALKAKIKELFKDVERLQEEKNSLNDKIAAIHYSQGIEREQTKYLTSNLNAHTSMGTPMHGGTSSD